MDRSEGKSPRRASGPDGFFPSRRALDACQWHASNADRAEGETAARREQAKRDKKEALSRREAVKCADEGGAGVCNVPPCAPGGNAMFREIPGA